MDGRTRPIALPSPPTPSVIMFRLGLQRHCIAYAIMSTGYVFKWCVMTVSVFDSSYSGSLITRCADTTDVSSHWYARDGASRPHYDISLELDR